MINTSVNTALKQRFDRAIEGLKKGLYTVRGPRKVGDRYEWKVINSKAAYTTTFNKDSGFTCECPDFAKRGGVCKHIIMTRVTYDLRHDAKYAPLSELLADEGIVETLWDTVQQMVERYAKHQATEATEPDTLPADEPPAAPTPPPNGTGPNGAGDGDADHAELPEADTVMPWGKYKGRTFGEMVEDPDAAGYLLWLAKKWEPREGETEEAERLKASARTVLEAWASRQADAVMDGKAPMPTVPFGEDKGKPLSGPGACHPKWVAILAKKSLADAWNFEDAVTFEVARRLKARMDEKRWGNRRGSGGGGTSDEAVRELAAAIRELAAAIREAGRLDYKALQQVIQHGITQATVHHVPFRV